MYNALGQYWVYIMQALDSAPLSQLIGVCGSDNSFSATANNVEIQDSTTSSTS